MDYRDSLFDIIEENINYIHAKGNIIANLCNFIIIHSQNPSLVPINTQAFVDIRCPASPSRSFHVRIGTDLEDCWADTEVGDLLLRRDPAIGMGHIQAGRQISHSSAVLVLTQSHQVKDPVRAAEGSSYRSNRVFLQPRIDLIDTNLRRSSESGY